MNRVFCVLVIVAIAGCVPKYATPAYSDASASLIQTELPTLRSFDKAVAQLCIFSVDGKRVGDWHTTCTTEVYVFAGEHDVTFGYYLFTKSFARTVRFNAEARRSYLAKYERPLQEWNVYVEEAKTGKIVGGKRLPQ